MCCSNRRQWFGLAVNGIALSLILLSIRQLIVLPSLEASIDHSHEPPPTWNSTIEQQFNSESTTFAKTSNNDDVHSSISIPHCTNYQLNLVEKMLPNGNAINRQTNCPDATWMEDAAPTSNRRSILREPVGNRTQPPLAIFVGCNKALDAVKTLRTLSFNDTYDKDLWRDEMNISSSACRQHLTPQLYIPPTVRARNALVFCIEAMPSTARRLQQTVTSLGWQDSLRIHHIAVSDTNGHVLFPNVENEWGVEDLGLADCHKPAYMHNCETVEQYQLDSFVEDHVLSEHSPTQSPMILDYLSIDVEGFDWNVLQGSTNYTLYHTKYLEFEYHHVGAWKSTRLSTAVDFLQDYGFVCYWAGMAGKLWRITHCWRDDYDASHQWSNVACVNIERAPTLSRRMEAAFQRTLQTFEKQALRMTK